MVSLSPAWRFACLVALLLALVLLALVAASLAGALPDSAELSETIKDAGGFAPLLIIE